MQQIEKSWYEYIGEIPLNTLKTWSETILHSTSWQPAGWSGAPKEPYRHWCSYPEFKGVFSEVWNCVNVNFLEEGFRLAPNRVITNLYNHGDSSWLHIDSSNSNAWTVIVYMNDFWDLNWGGETVLVKDNEIIKSFAPTPGKFILFRSNILHGPRPVSREAPYGRFGLTFQCDNL